MHRRAIVSAAVSLVLWAPRVVGQTFFAWPDTAVNWLRYTTIEQCEAALNRSELSHQVRGHVGPWVDTMPDYASLDQGRKRRGGEGVQGDSAIARTAQGCMARFATTDSVPLDKFTSYARLYLAANSPSKINALLERIVATTPEQLYTAVDTTVAFLGQTDTTAYALAEGLVMRYGPRVSRPDRARLYQSLVIGNTSLARADTVRALRAIRRLEQFATDSLTASDSTAFWGGQNPELATWIRQNYFFIRQHDLVLLDSLRKSTAAYLAAGYNSMLIRQHERTANGKDTTITKSLWAATDLFGEHAIPIRAVAWAGRDDSTSPRPVPGHVGLIVFLDPAFCTAGSWTCPLEMAALHRLTTRLPALEVTVVLRGMGYYRWVVTTPAEEATMVHQMMVSYGIPTAVAITSPEYYKRPQPDGRRVERHTPDSNWVYYQEKLRAHQIAIGADSSNIDVPDEPYGAYASLSLLTDEKGVIVLQSPVTNDKVIGDYAEVLLERLKQQPGTP